MATPIRCAPRADARALPRLDRLHHGKKHDQKPWLGEQGAGGAVVHFDPVKVNHGAVYKAEDGRSVESSVCFR